MVGSANRRVQLSRAGLRLADDVVPLHAGSLHYFQLEPRHWRACLTALRDMGIRLIDVYLPWDQHEVAPGKVDLSGGSPRLDVVAFLRLVEQLGLYAIVRPGPHINAELTYFGIPKRVIWDEACQARGPSGKRVILPALPTMFPVPSYASEAYLDEVTRYLQAVAETLAPLRYPDGPIVMVQVDNEAALFFRDGVYEQDYHPDAIGKYRAFLRQKYPNIDALGRAYEGVTEWGYKTPREEGAPLRFATIEPPVAGPPNRVEELAYHLDWAEFQSHLIAQALERFRGVLETAGLSGLVMTHNYPPAHQASPLDHGHVARAVDLVGYDFYNRATPDDRHDIALRAGQLRAYAEAHEVPAFASELGAGFPPYFPPLSEADSAFAALTAIAYGVDGFNVYMAVERDRWIGSPIDRRGKRRPFADFWEKLCAVLLQCGIHELKRRVSVKLIIPAVQQRLARVSHAFGPLSGSLLSTFGLKPRDRCFEHDYGLGYAPVIEADAFLGDLEQALDGRGMAYSIADGADASVAVAGAPWLICISGGALDDVLVAALEDKQSEGVRVSLGPHAHRFDGQFMPAEDALTGCDLLAHNGLAELDTVLEKIASELGITSQHCGADGLRATYYEDSAGVLRLIFLINATEDALVAEVPLDDATWFDPFEGKQFEASDGVLRKRIAPRSVQLLARRRVADAPQSSRRAAE